MCLRLVKFSSIYYINEERTKHNCRPKENTHRTKKRVSYFDKPNRPEPEAETAAAAARSVSRSRRSAAARDNTY